MSKINQKCICCDLNAPTLNVTLKTKSGDFTYCPNCLSIVAQNGFAFDLIGNEICDITGMPNAVRYESQHETYNLNGETLLRLLNLNLKPNDYKALVTKYSENNYMLHDDFYDRNTGEALQPH